MKKTKTVNSKKKPLTQLGACVCDSKAEILGDGDGGFWLRFELPGGSSPSEVMLHADAKLLLDVANRIHDALAPDGGQPKSEPTEFPGGGPGGGGGYELV